MAHKATSFWIEFSIHSIVSKYLNDFNVTKTDLKGGFGIIFPVWGVVTVGASGSKFSRQLNHLNPFELLFLFETSARALTERAPNNDKKQRED